MVALRVGTPEHLAVFGQGLDDVLISFESTMPSHQEIQNAWCDPSLRTALGLDNLTKIAALQTLDMRCELASGRRYITAGQPKLEDAFTCIASMGTNGAEGVAGATVLALANDMNALDGCNEGFLRDDALLVVVVIQDTFDQESEGTAEDWAAAIVDAKGGAADAVVLFVITTDVEGPDGLCGYTGTITPHELRTWTELLPHSVFGSICADGYAGYFDAAATKSKTQCVVFVPQ